MKRTNDKSNTNTVDKVGSKVNVTSNKINLSKKSNNNVLSTPSNFKDIKTGIGIKHYKTNMISNAKNMKTTKSKKI